MKVGIMSMQRIINYGSFLQSYSLKKNFEALGAETTFVDYVPGEVLVSKKDGKDGKLSKILNKVRSHVLFPRKNNNELMNSYWRDYQKLDSSFYSDVLPLLGVTKEKNYKPELDAGYHVSIVRLYQKKTDNLEPAKKIKKYPYKSCPIPIGMTEEEFNKAFCLV